jgi:hypothetical protein
LPYTNASTYLTQQQNKLDCLSLTSFCIGLSLHKCSTEALPVNTRLT